MNPVWVMSEDEKKFASVATLILLLGIGVFFLWTWLFPSESSLLSDAAHATSSLKQKMESLDQQLKRIDRLNAEPTTAQNLTDLGKALHEVKETLAQARADLATIHKRGHKLSKSSDTAVRLEAAGYVKTATESQPAVDALANRVAAAEQKLQDKAK